MKTLVTAAVACFLSLVNLAAQETVSGTVTDSLTDNPLSGVTVTVIGSGTSATTDGSGAFSIGTNSISDIFSDPQAAGLQPVRILNVSGRIMAGPVSMVPDGVYLCEYLVNGTPAYSTLVKSGSLNRYYSSRTVAGKRSGILNLVFRKTGYAEKQVAAAGGTTDMAVALVPVAAGKASLTGGVLSGTVDLSGLTPGSGTTGIEIMVCPAEGDTTTPTWPPLPAQDNSTLCSPGTYINSFDPVIPVAGLSAPVTVDRIPLPGQYRVWTRELNAGSPVTAWIPSAPATVTHTDAAYAKEWYDEAAGMTGPDALGNTVGRTSTAALTLIDPETMTDTEVRAVLPSGWTFNRSTNSAMEPPAGADSLNPAVMENYELRNVRIRLRGGRDHVHVRQCLIYPAWLSNPFIMIERGARLRDFSHNTVIGPRVFSGTGQVVQCQYPITAGQGRGIVDLISCNVFTGMHGDNCSATGSPVTRTAPDPDGTWIHHNLFDAEGYATDGPADWWVGTKAPHADGLTFKGSYDNGIYCDMNVFWQVPVEPISIPASLSHNGSAIIAGAARPYAGSRGGTVDSYYKIGDEGIAGQNNMVRILQDNSQLVDSTTWAGPVRLTRFIQTKWVGMAGLTMAVSGAARVNGDVAIYDGLASPGSNLGYTKVRFHETERTTMDAFFGMPAPKDWGYFGEVINFWTGEAVEEDGTPDSLATALRP